MCGEVNIHLSGSCIVVKYMKDGIKVNRWTNNIPIYMHVPIQIILLWMLTFLHRFEYVILNFNEHWM
jgi:hypothetical protein